MAQAKVHINHQKLSTIFHDYSVDSDAPVVDEKESVDDVSRILLIPTLSHVDGYRYYTISVILGTVALSYGSVPMYKMVSLEGQKS